MVIDNNNTKYFTRQEVKKTLFRRVHKLNT